MRKSPNLRIEDYRMTHSPFPSSWRDGNNGAFVFIREGVRLCVIASDGGGYDHVSVRVIRNPPRCPTWEEMCFVKDLFFHEEECVLQFHPPRKDYVNTHAYVLHLWKKQGVEVELPPSWMTGLKEGESLEEAVQKAREAIRQME